MNTLHLVSHTHWDREWYLTFQQFRLKLIHLMDRLLSILEYDPQYASFMLDGQAIILEDYLQIRPEKEADVNRMARDGRLFIGPWYISPDEFLVSPESHVRNLLEGRHICQKYGTQMLVGYLPDTFGHIAQMPQILQGFGIDAACLWRGLDDQPIELMWKSPDGTSVLLSYLRDSYANAASLSPSDLERFIDGIQECSQSLSTFSATGQILLMHGADHMEPSFELSRAIKLTQGKSSGDLLVHSNLPAYFAGIRQQIISAGTTLPSITGELRSSKHSPLLPNVLSTRIDLKQRNNYCETELLKWVEPLSAWAFFSNDLPNSKTYQSNQSYPFIHDQNSPIHQAWKLLMQCHAHDSICGTSIDQVASEMHLRLDQVEQIAQELIAQNLHRISDQIDTSYPGGVRQSDDSNEFFSSIIVFNPNDEPQSGLIDLDIKLDNRFTSVEITDDQNTVIPYDQSGSGFSELISMTLDKKGLKQGLGMVDEGNVAGMVIREFDIEPQGHQAVIRATISDHGLVDIARWKQGMAKLDAIFGDPQIDEFIVHAYSDPETNLAFIAGDVPGHGYRRYWIRASLVAGSVPPVPKRLNRIVEGLLPIINLVTRVPFLSRFLGRKKTKRSSTSGRIENDFFVVEASSHQDAIKISDKRTHQVFLGLNRFIDGADCGDLYNYSPPGRDQVCHAHLIGIQHEQSKISQKLIAHYELSLPVSLSRDRKSRSSERIRHKIISTITLVPGVPRVDIHTEIDNQARDHRLRVHFPAPFSCTTALTDGHYELVERTIGLPNYDDSWIEPPRPEVPQRQFTLVTDDRTSLTIANRGLPEVEVIRNESGNVEIALTLLRSVGWLSRDDITTRKGHAGPMGIATPGAQMIGKYSFDYSIIPGDKNLHASIHQAYAFNAPMKAIYTSVHQGHSPAMRSLVENNSHDFIITSIKLGEDNSSLVVRGYNLTSARVEVTITPFRVFNRAQLLNMGEEPQRQLSMTPSGQATWIVESKQIATIGFSD